MKSVFVRARLKRLLFSAFLLPLLMPHAFGAQPELNANSEPVRTVSCAENFAGGGICFVNTSCLDPNLTYKVIYSDPNSPETFSSLIAQGLLETVALSATTPQFLYICGKVNVDVAPYVFAAGSEIIFSTNGSGFNVLSSADLTLERTYVHGCEKLWESIAVQGGGILAVLSGSRIEDAVAAIDLLPNAWLVSINSTYDGNYTAIKASNLGSGPNSVSFANFLVYCNLFSGAKALLEPYTITSGGSPIGTVTTPYYGIVMINVSHVQIGFGTSLSHRNIFRDFTPSISGGGLNPPIPTGIDGTNSNITALNNQFINIGVPNVNEGRGVYFISPGSASSTLHFTGLGKNLTTTPTFETCQVGIEGLGNMQISESYFTDLLFGIYLNGTTDPYSIGIENNRFDIVREETIITNNITTLSKLVISGNDFIDNDPYLGASGFSRTAVSLRTFVPGTQTTLVKENRFFNESKTGTFNFNYRGVWVNNQDGTAIIDNDFYDNFSGTSNTYWGVYGNNATTWVWDNYFRGAGNFSVHPAFATQFIESPDCQLFCNTAHLTKIGFDFKGNNCDNAYLQKNIFNTHDASLRLQSDAIIGLQSRRENKWVGSTSPVEALFMGRDPFNLLDQLHISFSRFLINDPNLLSDY
ncbi:MAG: hypothetical protein HUU01_16900, partial [Saprospiraceae bacterium]|nr:hypothetical protein [Saprospiraceae bacterium]